MGKVYKIPGFLFGFLLSRISPFHYPAAMVIPNSVYSFFKPVDYQFPISVSTAWLSSGRVLRQKSIKALRPLLSESLPTLLHFFTALLDSKASWLVITYCQVFIVVIHGRYSLKGTSVSIPNGALI